MNSIRCHKQNDSPNRNDLSSFLKVVNDVEVEWRAGGKLSGNRRSGVALATRHRGVKAKDREMRTRLLSFSGVWCNFTLPTPLAMLTI